MPPETPAEKQSRERRERADQDAALRQAQMSLQIKQSETQKKYEESQKNANSGSNR